MIHAKRGTETDLSDGRAVRHNESGNEKCGREGPANGSGGNLAVRRRVLLVFIILFLLSTSKQFLFSLSLSSFLEILIFLCCYFEIICSC